MNHLIQFLLARIAEDEGDAAIEAVLRSDDPYWASGEASVWERRMTPARVLVECEAKRGIVADVASGYGPGSDVVPMPLALLALPYADHPDYRDEWRP